MSESSASKGPGAMRSPLEAFTGEIEPTQVPPLYKLAIAVVAFTMVLLPAIYIALVGLTGYGVYYYAIHGLAVFKSAKGTGALLVYLGPLVIGGVLVIFMIKPLFAREPEQVEPVSLKPEDEPVLFAFIKRICQLVRAPVPTRVDVDSQVNASAGFRRGLLSMAGNDLVLTIGLPLAAGLNMRELGGVLAHEFGHFAQGGGMRMSYVVRRVSHWFARVVYERDQWDIQLEQAARGSDIRIAIVLHAARLMVWLTRRILWLLMIVGNAISCFLLRQMEFDADSYECKVAGSDSFASTASKLRRLGVGSQMAMEDVRVSWQSHRLPDSFAAMVGHKAATMPGDILEKIEKGTEASKTGAFDTHPSDPDRVQAANRINAPGVFRLDDPSTALFRNFEETSRIVTRHLYEKVFELDVKDAVLVDAGEAMRESSASAEANEAMERYFQGVSVYYSPLVLRLEDTRAQADVETSRAALAGARDRMARLHEKAKKEQEVHSPAGQLASSASVALHLAGAGFEFEAGAFGLARAGKDGAIDALERANRDLQQLNESMRPFVDACRDRLTASLQLLNHETACEGLANLAELRREAGEVAPVLERIGLSIPSLIEMQRSQGALQVLAQNIQNHSAPGQVRVEMEEVATSALKHVRKVQAILSQEGAPPALSGQPPAAPVAYPFSHAKGRITLAEYAREDRKFESKIEEGACNASSHVDRLFTLYFRVLGRLVWIAEQVEGHVKRGE